MFANLIRIFAGFMTPNQVTGLEDRPEGVFVLAGHPNMEGKAPNALLDHQATDPKTRDLFSHLRRDNQWIVRDDVFIKFLDRKRKLTTGFGSPNRTGPELEFGTVMGNHFGEPAGTIRTTTWAARFGSTGLVGKWAM